MPLSEAEYAARCLFLARAPVAEVLAAASACADVSEVVLRCVAAETEAASDYARRVLRATLSLAEAAGKLDNDELHEAHAAALLAPRPAGELTWHHKVFHYGKERTLRLRCSADLLACATGAHDWQAGLALAELALSVPRIFAGKRVVELGSGCGAAAVAIARARPAMLLCSDGNPATLANLRTNLELNGVHVGADSPIRVHRLAWESVDDALALELRADVVVAADVAYDPESCRALVAAFQTLVGYTRLPGADAPEGILVAVLRTEETTALLLSEAQAAGLHPRDDTQLLLGSEGEAGRVRFHHPPAANADRSRLRAFRLQCRECNSEADVCM